MPVNKKPAMSICRTVFILSEALDEQLKALWFSPFQTDDIETDLDMVCVLFVFLSRIFRHSFLLKSNLKKVLYYVFVTYLHLK